jgi:hypothetical protein
MSKFAEEDSIDDKEEAPGGRNTPTKSDPAADAARSFLSAAVQSAATEWNRKPTAATPGTELHNRTVVVEEDSLGSPHVARKKIVFHGNSLHLPSLGKTPSPPSSIRSKQMIDNMFTEDVLLPRISDGK